MQHLGPQGEGNGARMSDDSVLAPETTGKGANWSGCCPCGKILIGHQAESPINYLQATFPVLKQNNFQSLTNWI